MPAFHPIFRALSTVSGASATTCAGSEPTGTALNDILVAGLYMESDVAVVPPAGWYEVFDNTATHLFAEANTGGSAFRLHGYWTRRGGSAPSYTFTWDGTSVFRGLIVAAYARARQTDSPWSFGSKAVRDSTASKTFPDVTGTTLDANETLIWICGGFDAGNSGLTQPTGYNKLHDLTSGRGLADNLLASPGSTTSTGASYSGGTNNTAASLLFGLRPQVDPDPSARFGRKMAPQQRYVQ